MELYTVETKYINYLSNFQVHIWDNKENGNLRPYVGIVLNIGDYKYYAPLTSPKPKHNNMPERLDLIRLEYKKRLIAVINLNNIIPVSDRLISKIDMDNLTDRKYKELLNIEIIQIRRKQSVILKNAKILYNKMTKFRNDSQNAKLVSICYDFHMLEQKLDEYMSAYGYWQRD